MYLILPLRLQFIITSLLNRSVILKQKRTIFTYDKNNDNITSVTYYNNILSMSFKQLTLYNLGLHVYNLRELRRFPFEHIILFGRRRAINYNIM